MRWKSSSDAVNAAAYNRSVRGLYMLGVLAGCFAPSAPAGVPCDPAASRCPSGQSCVATPTGHVCSAHDAGSLVEADAPPTDPDAASPDAIQSIQRTYVAAI